MKSRLPSLKRPGRVALAVAIAAALNCIHVDVIGDADFLLGLLVSIPLVLVLPAPWAILAAAVAALPTLVVHDRPFVLALASLEAAWLVTFARRWRSAALADLAYWIIVGIPLGLWLYRTIEELPLDYVVVLLGNHALNALAAVLAAEFVVRSTPMGEWFGHARVQSPVLRGSIFNAVFALAALPLIAMTCGTSLMLRNAAVERERMRFEQAVGQVGRNVELYLRLHQAAVVTAARTVEQSSAATAIVLAETRRTHPEFIAMLVTDAGGRVLTTSANDNRPVTDTVADRHYFRDARDQDRPVISGVFRDGGLGNDALVAISVPMHDRQGMFSGVVEAFLEVQRFGAAVGRFGLSADISVVLVDASGRVIFADRGSGLRPLDQLAHSVFAPVAEPSAHDAVTTLDVVTNDGTRQRLRAQYVPAAFGISLVAIRSASVGVEQLLIVYLLLGAVIAIAVVGAVFLATVASRRLALPLERFARDAVDQAESGAVTEMAPPAERVPREVEMVFAAFNCLVGRMRESHAALVRTNAELDARVAERTKELRAAQQRAEAASRSKSEFVAMTGHEIRTPLNAMIGLAETVAEDVPSGPTAERLQLIRRAGVRLLGVVNDLLDLSRVEAGKLDLRCEPAEIGGVANELIALFSSRARQQGLSLTADMGVTLPLWLQIDSPRLQQVLSNLIANALKFTKEGGIRLQIVAVAQTATHVSLRFAVIDTGPGIPPAEQARLFQPYVQLSGAAAANGAGTGLGLAISRRLVELLGGELAVRSAPGQGSEFYFTATFTRTAPVRSTSPAARDESLKGLRVLVADDNPANQEVLRAFLERGQAQVETVDSARAALERLEHETFDVALIDLEMPGETGDVVARAVVAQRVPMKSRDCVLVAVSAHMRDEKRAECLAAGFHEFLSKPIDRHELNKTLRRLVAAAR